MSGNLDLLVAMGAIVNDDKMRERLGVLIEELAKIQAENEKQQAILTENQATLTAIRQGQAALATEQIHLREQTEALKVAQDKLADMVNFHQRQVAEFNAGQKDAEARNAQTRADLVRRGTDMTEREKLADIVGADLDRREALVSDREHKMNVVADYAKRLVAALA